MPSRKLSDCDPRLEAAFLNVKAAYEAMFPERELRVTCTHRSVDEQMALFAQGRTKPGPRVTNCDGVTKVSKHNHLPSLAVDVCVVVRGANIPATSKAIVSWDVAMYRPLIAICDQFGLVSGGSWNPQFQDWPHIELPGVLNG